MTQKIEGVYILHLSAITKYPHAAQYGDRGHYVGCSTDILERFQQHVSGRGSKYTQFAKNEGIELTLAAIFPGELMSMENAITRFGAYNLCPFCITADDKDLKVDREKGLSLISYQDGHDRQVVSKNDWVPPPETPRMLVKPKKKIKEKVKHAPRIHEYRHGKVGDRDIPCKNKKCTYIMTKNDDVYLSGSSISPLCARCCRSRPHAILIA